MECRPEIGWAYQHLLLSIEKKSGMVNQRQAVIF